MGFDEIDKKFRPKSSLIPTAKLDGNYNRAKPTAQGGIMEKVRGLKGDNLESLCPEDYWYRPDGDID